MDLSEELKGQIAAMIGSDFQELSQNSGGRRRSKWKEANGHGQPNASWCQEQKTSKGTVYREKPMPGPSFADMRRAAEDIARKPILIDENLHGEEREEALRFASAEKDRLIQNTTMGYGYLDENEKKVRWFGEDLRGYNEFKVIETAGEDEFLQYLQTCRQDDDQESYSSVYGRGPFMYATMSSDDDSLSNLTAPLRLVEMAKFSKQPQSERSSSFVERGHVRGRRFDSSVPAKQVSRPPGNRLYPADLRSSNSSDGVIFEARQNSATGTSRCQKTDQPMESQNLSSLAQDTEEGTDALTVPMVMPPLPEPNRPSDGSTAARQGTRNAKKGKGKDRSSVMKRPQWSQDFFDGIQKAIDLGNRDFVPGPVHPCQVKRSDSSTSECDTEGSDFSRSSPKRQLEVLPEPGIEDASNTNGPCAVEETPTECDHRTDTVAIVRGVSSSEFASDTSDVDATESVAPSLDTTNKDESVVTPIDGSSHENSSDATCELATTSESPEDYGENAVTDVNTGEADVELAAAVNTIGEVESENRAVRVETSEELDKSVRTARGLRPADIIHLIMGMEFSKAEAAAVVGESVNKEEAVHFDFPRQADEDLEHTASAITEKPADGVMEVQSVLPPPEVTKTGEESVSQCSDGVKDSHDLVTAVEEPAEALPVVCETVGQGDHVEDAVGAANPEGQSVEKSACTVNEERDSQTLEDQRSGSTSSSELRPISNSVSSTDEACLPGVVSDSKDFREETCETGNNVNTGSEDTTKSNGSPYTSGEVTPELIAFATEFVYNCVEEAERLFFEKYAEKQVTEAASDAMVDKFAEQDHSSTDEVVEKDFTQPPDMKKHLSEEDQAEQHAAAKEEVDAGAKNEEDCRIISREEMPVNTVPQDDEIVRSDGDAMTNHELENNCEAVNQDYEQTHEETIGGEVSSDDQTSLAVTKEQEPTSRADREENVVTPAGMLNAGGTAKEQTDTSQSAEDNSAAADEGKTEEAVQDKPAALDSNEKSIDLLPGEGQEMRSKDAEIPAESAKVSLNEAAPDISVLGGSSDQDSTKETDDLTAGISQGVEPGAEDNLPAVSNGEEAAKIGVASSNTENISEKKGKGDSKPAAGTNEKHFCTHQSA